MPNNNDDHSNPPAPPAEDPNPAQFHLAFQRLEAEIRAVPEKDLLPINIDIPGAVATVLGSVPEIQNLKEMAAQLPVFNLQAFLKLRDYALALGHAHGVYRAAAGSSDNVSDLVREAQALRDTLQADAAALAKRKLLDETRVLKLRGGNAYKNIAFDLIGLVELFLEAWSRISARTAVQQDELERARLIANRLVAAVGLREQAPAAVGAASQVRQQAFTLLSRAYEETRRAMQFVRWYQGDAESIAPSLYAGRGTRPALEEVAPNPDNASKEPESAVPNPPDVGEAGSGAGVGALGAANASIPMGFPGAPPLLGRKA